MSINRIPQKCFVIIPVYNEQYHLAKILKDLSSIENIEILIVNDHSTDNSVMIASNHKVNCIDNFCGKGRDGAILTGLNYYLKQQPKEWIVIFDADGQHPTDFLNHITEESANFLYKGNRFSKLSKQFNTPPDRLFLAKELEQLIRLKFRIVIKDPNCGLLGIPHHCLCWIKANCNFDKHVSLDICIRLLCQFSQKMFLKEIPIPALYLQDSARHKINYDPKNVVARHSERRLSLLAKLVSLENEIIQHDL